MGYLLNNTKIQFPSCPSSGRVAFVGVFTNEAFKFILVIVGSQTNDLKSLHDESKNQT